MSIQKQSTFMFIFAIDLCILQITPLPYLYISSIGVSTLQKSPSNFLSELYLMQV